MFQLLYGQQAVVAELFKIMLEAQVVQVVEEVLLQVQVAQELQAKEITEETVQLLIQYMLAVAAVALEHRAEMLHYQMLEMVVTELHHHIQVHQ
jgi:hypothetical protein